MMNSMDRKQLLERLTELHHELQRAELPEAEKHELLRQLANAIQALLDQSDSAALTGPPGLRHRLEDAALRLEATHPEATMMMGRVIDTLVQLGI